MNDAGWTVQETLAVLARQDFDIVWWLCVGSSTILAGLLLWAFWPCIVGRISWRD